MSVKQTKVTQVKNYSITITADEFRAMFDLPVNAEIKLLTPGGPAWDGSTTRVETISRFVASWEEKEVVDVQTKESKP